MNEQNQPIYNTALALVEFKKFLKEHHVYKEFKLNFWKYYKKKYKEFSIIENMFDILLSLNQRQLQSSDDIQRFAISAAFSWQDTKEKFLFWQNIHCEWLVYLNNKKYNLKHETNS